MPDPTMKPQLLKGFRDFLPGTMILRQRIIGRVREVFERHGFAPLETPVLEYYETLAGKYGEEERLLYHFTDHGGREVGLRYDLTVPLARVIGLAQHQITFPFKRYHIGPVWRAEKPQHGRYREFYQCDVDIVGSTSPVADAEVLATILDAMDTLGFTGYRILMNNRKLLAAMARYAGVPDEGAGSMIRALDKLDKIGREGVQAEMERYGLPAEAARRALDFVSTAADGDNLQILGALEDRLAADAAGVAAIRELREILVLLGTLSPSAARVEVDLSLARGLDYYTGPVFEAVVDEPKIGSLSGGGRYDNLVGMFSGRALPTVGMSLGLERLIDVMTELGMEKASGSVSQVFVVVMGRDALDNALELVRAVRHAGIAAEVNLEPDDKVGKQLKYAGQQGIPLALIAGPDEIAKDEVQIKDLRRGEQDTVLRADLVPTLRRLLDLPLPGPDRAPTLVTES
jgi:histidyl-tRNA synthetase